MLMNRTKPPKYSQAILMALQAKGFALLSIQRAARASAEFMIGALDGRRELSDAQIQRLESLSGFSGLQLAASICEPAGGDLTELADALAAARSSNFKRARPRGAKRRSTLAVQAH
jgi:hypothetical protein